VKFPNSLEEWTVKFRVFNTSEKESEEKKNFKALLFQSNSIAVPQQYQFNFRAFLE